MGDTFLICYVFGCIPLKYPTKSNTHHLFVGHLRGTYVELALTQCCVKPFSFIYIYAQSPFTQDTYGTYAELRHKVSFVVNEGGEKASDIEAQRNYMDTVCRSYAARIEKRRNLIITSVRYHRLAEEVNKRGWRR